jgi:hypothetical protein
VRARSNGIAGLLTLSHLNAPTSKKPAIFWHNFIDYGRSWLRLTAAKRRHIVVPKLSGTPV